MTTSIDPAAVRADDRLIDELPLDSDDRLALLLAAYRDDADQGSQQ